MVNFTLCPIYPLGIIPIPIEKEAEFAPVSVWMELKPRFEPGTFRPVASSHRLSVLHYGYEHRLFLVNSAFQMHTKDNKLLQDELSLLILDSRP